MEFLKANWKSAFFCAFVAILCEELWRWLKEVVWTLHWPDSEKIFRVLSDSSAQAAILGSIAPIVAVTLYFRRYKFDLNRPNQFPDLVFLPLAITYFFVFLISLLTHNTDGLLRDLSDEPFSKVILFGYLIIRLGGEMLDTLLTGNGAERRIPD